MVAATSQPRRMYIVVREDLPVGLLTAQAVHAGFLFAQKHPEVTQDWMRDSQYLIVLGVPDESALHAFLKKAEEAGVPACPWFEPDLEEELTAVALEPGEGARKLCANLPLAGKQEQGQESEVSLSLWGIQFLEHYNDYPEWFDHMNPDGSAIRFASVEEAESYLTGKLDKEYQDQLACWVAADKEYREEKKLHEQYKAVLQEAGLDPSRILFPSVLWAGSRPLPPEMIREKWRIMPDEEMDEPEVRQSRNHCASCGRGEL